MNEIVLTADGSNTFYSEQIGETYHSKHGAVQESEHVFVKAGYLHAEKLFPEEQIHILEVGFGTGLNFLLTAQMALLRQKRISYTSLEAFPLSSRELESTKYQQYVDFQIWDGLTNNYGKALHQRINIVNDQDLKIEHIQLQRYTTDRRFHVLYYDAFSVRHQPEMWTPELIGHACSFLLKGGIFVTYAITGNLKRILKDLGFIIEKLQGAKGKREMLRAIKV